MATFTFEIRNPIRIWLDSHPKFRIISRAQVQFRVSQNRRRLPLPTHPLHIFSPQVVQNKKRELSGYLLLSLVMSSFLISEKTMRCSII